MSTRYGLEHLRSAQTALSCILLIGSMTNAHADAAEDADQSRAHSLDPVLVTAQALHGPQSAPSQGSLVATQPQSIVGAEFIQNNDAPAANYTDIINSPRAYGRSILTARA
jgi:iron complex outermembrane receptor protein